MAVFHATFHTDSTFAATFRSSATFAASFGNTIEVPVADYYEGEYEITPGDEDVTVHASGLVMRENLVVKAVPSNYGLITWNGTELTVS